MCITTVGSGGHAPATIFGKVGSRHRTSGKIKINLTRDLNKINKAINNEALPSFRVNVT